MTGGYTQTHRLVGGFMTYTVEMGSGAMIHIPSLIKNGSGIQRMMAGGGIDRNTHSMVIS
jgi:hypothetical protein